MDTTNKNSVDFLLSTKFDSLDFASKCDVKAKGRQKPFFQMSQSVPHSKSSKPYTRHFNSSSYEKYDWLMGCDKRKKLFCFPCLLFDSKTNSPWTTHDYSDLSNLSRSCRKHEESSSLKVATLSLERFGSDRIECSLSVAHREQIRKHNEMVDRNRQILERFIDVTRFIAIHEQGFRGNDESKSSSMQGNFKDQIDLLSKYDSLLELHLSNASVFRGDSKTIQNDLIFSLSECIMNKIRDELNQAKFVSVGVDETSDISSTTQCAITFRYVTTVGSVVERFIGFFNVSGIANAKSITDLVLSRIDDLNLRSKLIAQTYDGAATMSGCASGVQRRIQDEIPLAYFVHCWAHKLNLVLQNAVAGISSAKVFFSNLEGLHAFFSTSPKRLAALHSFDDSLHVTRPSRTRWTFKSRAIQTLLQNFATLLEFFQSVVDDQENWDSTSYNGCLGYISTFSSIKFRFLLTSLSDVFQKTKVLFEQLQKVECNILNACDRVRMIRQNIASFDSDEKFNYYYESANGLLPHGEPEVKKRKEVSKDELRSLHTTLIRSVLKHFDLRFDSLEKLAFLPLLDASRFQQYKATFPEHAFNALRRSTYSVFFRIDILKRELRLLYDDPLLKSEDISGILEKILSQNILKSYRQVVVLLELVLTLPITTAAAERSFSTLKRIKTASRNKMNDTRLSALALISIEREVASKVSYDQVIDKFAEMKDRRIPLIRK